MSFLTFVLTSTAAFLSLSQGAQPVVKCPVPVSPLNGQTFLTRMGTAVKYKCNAGFELRGPEIAICKEDQWYPSPPTCEPTTVDDEKEPMEIVEQLPSSSATPRPLFKWDDDSIKKNEVNDTMQNDEARVHMVLYPRGRVVTTTRVTPVNIRSAEKLEEEERKRSTEKQKSTVSTTSSNVVYVRRPVTTGKSWPYYHRTPVHVTKDNTQANEEALRYYYWHSQYPRSPLIEYRSGQPLGLTLSESQLTWINSLHPELRDRYLKDLYDMKAKEVDYLTYSDGYHWVSGHPYQVRQPLSVVIDDAIAALDYSCHRTESDGSTIMIKAPRLPNAYVHRYDRRKNPNYPHNDYLTAQYRCKAGYTLLDSRYNEMYCSRSTWIGNQPVCVPRA